jgi:hypothetical protein
MTVANPTRPLEAIRAKCLFDCCCKKQEEARECPVTECSLHRYRMMKGGGSKLNAIRKKCLDCSGGSSDEVKGCSVTDCFLFPYRFGKRPSTVTAKEKKPQTAAQIAGREKGLAALRAKKAALVGDSNA